MTDKTLQVVFMKMNKDESTIYFECFSKWNFGTQIDMAIEEMAELTQALCKAKRHNKPKDWLANVYEEIADVSIMLKQMIVIFDAEEIVPQIMERKLLDLSGRLKL